MSNAIICINKRFVFGYILSGFVIQLKQSKNENPALKKYVKVANMIGSMDAKHRQFPFQLDLYGLMV